MKNLCILFLFIIGILLMINGYSPQNKIEAKGEVGSSNSRQTISTEVVEVERAESTVVKLATEEVSYPIDINKFTNITDIRGLCYADEENIYMIGLNKDAGNIENGNCEIILAKYNDSNRDMEIVDTWKGTPEQTLRASKLPNGETTLFTGEMLYKISTEDKVLEKHELPKFQQREPCINFSANSMVYVHEDELNLYLYNFETKEDKLIYECNRTEDSNSFVYNPVISENGKYVFFQICSYEAMYIKNMYVMHLETGEMSEIDFHDIITGETYNIWLGNTPALISYVDGMNQTNIFSFDINGKLKNRITKEYLIEEIKWQNIRSNKIPCLMSKGSCTNNLIGFINPKNLEIDIINEATNCIHEYDISPLADELIWIESNNLFRKKV